MPKIPVTFTTGCAIERDYIFLSSKPDILDTEDDFSRQFFYDGQNATRPWFHRDLSGWSIVSNCLSKKTATLPRRYISLSKNGQVEYQWPGGSSIETIDGAGLLRDEPPIYGYVSSIREIDGVLYVCGSGGQIYRHADSGWQHMADSLKAPAELNDGMIADDFANHDFNDISGCKDDDLYVVGGCGEIFHFNGEEWRRCQTPTDDILTSVYCASKKEIWVAGLNGALLCGNVLDGFHAMSAYDDSMTFNSVAEFNDTVYVGSETGLFAYDKRNRAVVHVQAAGVADSLVLSSCDGVLWSIGYKEIVMFDGRNWKRLPHPDNDPATRR